MSELIKMIFEEMYEEKEFMKEDESDKINQELIYKSYEYKSRFYKKSKDTYYSNENTREELSGEITEETNEYLKSSGDGEDRVEDVYEIEQYGEKVSDKELVEDALYRKEIEDTMSRGIKEDVDYGDMSEYDIEGD